MGNNDIKGYDSFETEVEKTRIDLCVKIVKEIFECENIKYLVPTMAKDPSGKVSNIGLFIFTDTVLFEFRDFINSTEFDYIKYNNIYNIRVNVKGKESEFSSSESYIKLFVTHSQEGMCHSDITVFGQKACVLLWEIMKEFAGKLK